MKVKLATDVDIGVNTSLGLEVAHSLDLFRSGIWLTGLVKLSHSEAESHMTRSDEKYGT